MQGLAKGLRKAGADQRGFTLTELLVVIVIIGILVGIAVPVFLSQRERAWEAAAQSALRNAATAATTCSVDNDGSYEDCGEDALGAYGYAGDDNVNLEVNTAEGGWSATAVHQNGGQAYQFSTETGQVRPAQQPADDAGES